MLKGGDTNVRMWGEFWLNEVYRDTNVRMWGYKC